MIARVLIGPSQTRTGEIEKILAKIELTPNHPDLLYFPTESKLGMEQAKQIREFLSLKPYSAKGRAVVLADAASLTPEAQNALLKTLEEPPEEAILILGADSDVNLLSTILSRCELVILQSNINLVGRDLKTYEVYAKDIEKLMNQDIADRFEYIENLKTPEKRREFLQALVQYFHQQLASHSSSSPRSSPRGEAGLPRSKAGGGGAGGNVNFLKELLQAEEWADANVNIRGILEYLMLKLPK